MVDVKKIVLDRLNALQFVKYNKEVALSDYLISRKYINIYEPEFIKEVLGYFGENLIMLANLVDSEHPDLIKVFNGFLDINSQFSKDVLQNLDCPYLFNGQIQNKTRLFYKLYPKECKFIEDPRRYIHLFKEKSDIVKFRLLSKNINLKLKPRLFCKISEDFRFYTKHDDYYGFQRISMTNAAVILAKEFGRVSNVMVRPYNNKTIVNCDIKKINYFLERFPTCNEKPIFDRYWVVDSGRETYALLGEADSKCYFIIFWKK